MKGYRRQRRQVAVLLLAQQILLLKPGQTIAVCGRDSVQLTAEAMRAAYAHERRQNETASTHRVGRQSGHAG